MLVKSSHKGGEIRLDVLVTDCIARALPDLPLRIAVRTSGRKVQGLKTEMCHEKVMNSLLFVPARSIPTHKNGALGAARLELSETVNGHGRPLRRR
jgi:hypothetical protein